MEPLNPAGLPQGQVGLHPRLGDVVRRHLAHPDRAPVPEHTVAAYRALVEALGGAERPLVLDSGCGSGEGTVALARRHPEAWVVGVDRSQHRLHKGPFRGRGEVRRAALAENALAVRADVPGLWRLLVAEGRRLSAHYLLHPNPWPKQQHLQRRWHGHPAFTSLLALGGEVTLVSNFSVYAEEFAAALRLARPGLGPVVAEAYVPDPPLTRFEAKYLERGHPLWRVRADLGA